MIVPLANAFETQIIAYRSTNGGASWTAPVLVANVADHQPAGRLRAGPLPSAEMDAAGKVYVVWQDCRLSDKPVPNAASDHAVPRSVIRQR